MDICVILQNNVKVLKIEENNARMLYFVNLSSAALCMCFHDLYDGFIKLKRLSLRLPM